MQYLVSQDVHRHAVVMAQRDAAIARNDLAAALVMDDTLEDYGMAADERETCYACKSWADHSHDIFTGKRCA